jgi:hypothetical protein
MASAHEAAHRARGKELEKRGVESPLGDDLQRAVIEQLNVAHARAGDLQRCIEHIIEERYRIAAFCHVRFASSLRRSSNPAPTCFGVEVRTLC